MNNRYTEYKPNIDDVLEMCFILFDRCKQKWMISNKDLGDIISKYKLVSYIREDFNYLNTFGVDGCILEIEEHIERLGGKIV